MKNNLYNIYELSKQIVTLNKKIMYIHVENSRRPEIKFVPFGTIGYVKTIDNEVRQCKCLGGKTIPTKEVETCYAIQYEWKVAGYKEHFFTFSPSRISIGRIYVDEVSAQRGCASEYGPTQNGEMTATTKFPIFNYLINKYGMSVNCFKVTGTWNNCFHIETYAKFDDNTTGLRETDFEVIIDENGIDCCIPMLEGNVNGIQRFPTEEDAYAAMKPLKVYLLDDEEDDDVEPTTTKIKVTIEVEIDNIDNVKKYATILE